MDFGQRDLKMKGIGVSQWAQYFLDNFASVAEAVEAQKSFSSQVEPLILPNGFPTLVHISREDKSGNSAVIEYKGAAYMFSGFAMCPCLLANLTR